MLNTILSPRLRVLTGVILVFTTEPVWAADTGPVIFDLQTAEVTGEFMVQPQKPKFPVEPGPGISCGVTLRESDEHRAGADFHGWHLDFSFVHPSYLSGSETLSEDFFWNQKNFSTPFAPG